MRRRRVWREHWVSFNAAPLDEVSAWIEKHRKFWNEDIEHVGTYLEIDRPRRLVFSFGVPKFSAQMTRVSIDLKPLPTGCELTLTHEGVLPEWLDRTREGWGKIVDGLTANLTET